MLDSLLGVFGESATYTPTTGAAFAIAAIFSDGAQEGQPGTTGPVSMEALVSAFAVAPARGETVAWGSRSYRVTDVREDPALEEYIFALDEVR
jgi:hypothetical protein